MAGSKPAATSIFDVNLRTGTVALMLVVLLATTIMAPPATQAQTFSVIHYFTGGGDGANPGARLILDSGGSLYGGTELGGNSSEYCAPTCGTVFKISHARSGWAFTPLYLFHGTDGSSPTAINFGPDGILYGTAGYLFNLEPPASACKSAICYWTETVLYDGCCVFYAGPLIFDGEGNLYGTSAEGGIVNRCSGGLGCGFVYEMTPSDEDYWNESNLFIFNSGSAHPSGGFIFDQSGNLYGTTAGLYGGDGFGSVFELTPSGSGWTENTLYQFTSQFGTPGSFPTAGVILDAAGNFYGATTTGGSGGGGTVFELTHPGSGWSYNLLYSFTGSGYLPGVHQSLIMDAAGNLYGTTYYDGAYNEGSVFKLTPSGGNWTYTSLHDFTGGSDGANPDAGLILDSNGNLYGTTLAGGHTGANCASYLSYQCGVVFEITP